MSWITKTAAGDFLVKVAATMPGVVVQASEVPVLYPESIWDRWKDRTTMPDDFELILCECKTRRLIYRLRDHSVTQCRACARKVAQHRRSSRAARTTTLRRTCEMLLATHPDLKRPAGLEHAEALVEMVKTVRKNQRRLSVDESLRLARIAIADVRRSHVAA